MRCKFLLILSRLEKIYASWFCLIVVYCNHIYKSFLDYCTLKQIVLKQYCLTLGVSYKQCDIAIYYCCSNNEVLKILGVVRKLQLII